MGFWENVNEELKRAVEEGWSTVKDSARVGKLRYQIFTLHKSAEKNFTEVGGLVYEMSKSPGSEPFANTKILKLIDDIKKTEAEIELIEGEIEKIRKKEEAEPL